jgi:ankyrin repeat protein
MLEAGVDVNEKFYHDGKTLLILAAQYNSNPEVISVLLEAGADANKKDNSGRNARDYAGMNEHLQGTPVLRELQKPANP